MAGEFGSGPKITVEDYQKTAIRYRKDLLMVPSKKLESTLKFMTPRYGIRYAETVGELSGDIQFGPYSETREDNDDVVINPRTLYTYFGSVVKNFSPNKIYQSIFGSDITKGEALKRTDITLAVLTFLGAKLGSNLNKVIWNAVRSDSGSKSKELFNGYDTIAKKELDATNISTEKGNLFTIEAITKDNAVDVLKQFCRAASDELMDNTNVQLFCPRQVFLNYCDDYQASLGHLPYNKEFNKYFIDGFDNVTIVPLSNKKDSPFLQLTTKRNMLVGQNLVGEEENIEVARFKAFVLQFIATCFFGVEYESINKEYILFGAIDGTTPVYTDGGMG